MITVVLSFAMGHPRNYFRFSQSAIMLYSCCCSLSIPRIIVLVSFDIGKRYGVYDKIPLSSIFIVSD